MPHPPDNRREFESLLEVVTALRGKDGCPWDREQTHESLAKFAIEESFELVEAIESPLKDDLALKGELGDVLFQVVLHSEIARQEGRFDINDVIETLCEKMIRRHPHVFGDVNVKDSAEVIKNWQQIKALENSREGVSESPLKTPQGLPALMTAQKIGSKTKDFGFDWSEVDQVLEKVKEEVRELEEEVALAFSSVDREKIEAEIGDCLFSLAQLARHLKIDSEGALRKTNQRFRGRFDFMLSAVGGDVKKFTELSGEEKESLWEKAKASEKT